MVKNQKVNSNLVKTGLGMLLIILFMGLVFSFNVPLVYYHDEVVKANIVMWPLQQLSEILVYKWMGLTGNFASALAFFLAELPFVYLLIIIFAYLFHFARGFSTDQEISAWLATKDGFGGRVIGSIVGFISPFCSCSTIPIMTTLARSKAPFGTVIAFLITSPMINETGIAIMWSFFGYKVALIYIAFGFAIGLIGSYVATILKLENQFRIMPEMAMPVNDKNTMLKRQITFTYLHQKAWDNTKSAFISIWWIILLAMLVGSVMHGWIPETWIKNNIGNQWWAPLIMVPIGMALYLNISATLPITKSFVNAGLGLGPSLAFTMGVNTVSVPELIMLSKIFKTKFMVFLTTYMLLAILAFAYIIMAIPDSVLLT